MEDNAPKHAAVDLHRSCSLTRHKRWHLDGRDLHPPRKVHVTMVSTDRNFVWNVTRCDTECLAPPARAPSFKLANIVPL